MAKSLEKLKVSLSYVVSYDSIQCDLSFKLTPKLNTSLYEKQYSKVLKETQRNLTKPLEIQKSCRDTRKTLKNSKDLKKTPRTSKESKVP